MMISPRQIRAARALLDWSQQELADQAVISLNSLKRFESSQGDPRLSTLQSIQRALEKAGVEFIPADNKGEGVRMAKPD